MKSYFVVLAVFAFFFLSTQAKPQEEEDEYYYEYEDSEEVEEEAVSSTTTVTTQKPTTTTQTTTTTTRRPTTTTTPRPTTVVTRQPITGKRKKAKKTRKEEEEDIPVSKRFPTTFRCAGRRAGYYADVETDCRTYHVCNPTIDESGRRVVDRYTFLCEGNNIFNQDSLTCASEEESLPCEFAPALYNINEIHGSKDY
ncbi:uncharacterized protein LOC136042310 [Artemia franciscana]|uniref:Chitin-binding type-2 domain-containing protein n=2 Tax=Artemia franciscana TaxID=6661 RepID=A0AA88H274_ARTSF|nr:hypothetical protein QYM36_018547 [Artemia franciscana]